MFDAAAVQVLVKEEFEDTFYRTFEQNTFFFKMIAESGVKSSYVEKDITWKAYISGTPGAGSYREDGTIGINRADLGPAYTTARLGWALNKVPISVTGLSQAISQSSSSIIDSVAESTNDGLRQLQRNMNRQMLADGVGNLNGVDPDLNALGDDITGIQAMWDDGSAVPIYAGIDRGANTFWRSFVLANALGVDRPITEELMHQMLNELQGIRECNVTDITCSLGLLTQVGLLLGQDRRYNFSGTEDPRFRGGFMSVHFNGIEITGIPLYENGRMDFWDRALLSFKVLLDFKIEARDGGDADAMKMFAKTYSQMQYKNPYCSGSIRDLIQS